MNGLIRLGSLLSCLAVALACTDIIVSPEASTDGSAIVAYAADAPLYYGSVNYYAAADHPQGSMHKVYEWDGGRYLGEIAEVPHTYNVVSNINEHGLVIGESTFSGLAILQQQSAGKLDYGSMISITLQRARTAREAIATIAGLMAEYGYVSGGESFSIADPKEAWHMEIIGKGEYELGAVWVSRKVPAGFVTAHANQARIQTFSLHSPEDTLYSHDVISFARKVGLYPAGAADESFSFSDVYDPVTYEGARWCEGRVWAVFSHILGAEFAAEYEDYVTGRNLTHRMPLFIQPPQPISALDVMGYMRDYFQGTVLDPTGQVFSDVGAYTGSPFRFQPLEWQSTVTPEGVQGDVPRMYHNERTISDAMTGWSMVAQTRRNVPRELAAVIWFGVDDTATTVRIPLYGGATAVPESFAGQNSQNGVQQPFLSFSFERAHDVFNMVSNFAYHRWDLVYPDVLAKVSDLQASIWQQFLQADAQAVKLYASSAQEAVAFATQFGVDTGNSVTKQWADFFGQLFVKFRDGAIYFTDSTKPMGVNANPQRCPQQWYDRIVRDTGSHYAMPVEAARKRDRDSALFAPVHKSKTVSKF